VSAARPKRAGEAFGRLGAATATNPVPKGTGDTVVSRHHDTAEQDPPAGQPAVPRHRDTTVSQGKGKVEPVRKFTLRLYDERDADALDDWLRAARRRLGRRIDASRLVRELLREVAEDPALTARIHDRLRAEEPGM